MYVPLRPLLMKFFNEFSLRDLLFFNAFIFKSISVKPVRLCKYLLLSPIATLLLISMLKPKKNPVSERPFDNSSIFFQFHTKFDIIAASYSELPRI